MWHLPSDASAQEMEAGCSLGTQGHAEILSSRPGLGDEGHTVTSGEGLNKERKASQGPGSRELAGPSHQQVIKHAVASYLLISLSAPQCPQSTQV